MRVARTNAKIYTTSIIYKLINPCYSDDKEISKRTQSPQKGKDMTTVRFAYYLNSEYYNESLKDDKKEWSSFVRSFRIKQSRRITV